MNRSSHAPVWTCASGAWASANVRDERALADAGLAPDEHDLATGGAKAIDHIAEDPQLRVALQEHGTDHTLDRNAPEPSDAGDRRSRS